MQERDRLGGFDIWEQVKQVPGFEDKMVENLQAAGLSLGARSREEGGGRQERAAGRNVRSRDLNSASVEEVETVSQIDGERASYLIEARKRLGGFKSWDDVKREAVSFEDGMVERLQEAGFSIGNS